MKNSPHSYTIAELVASVQAAATLYAGEQMALKLHEAAKRLHSLDAETALLRNAAEQTSTLIADITNGPNDMPLRTILHRWSKASHIQLQAGEMSATELRAVKAVVAAITRECFPEDSSPATLPMRAEGK